MGLLLSLVNFTSVSIIPSTLWGLPWLMPDFGVYTPKSGDLPILQHLDHVHDPIIASMIGEFPTKIRIVANRPKVLDSHPFFLYSIK